MAQITNKEMPMALPSAREDNLQKSLYWLQQEHAKTLRDLHEEISKLQKRCSGELLTNYNDDIFKSSTKFFYVTFM